MKLYRFICGRSVAVTANPTGDRLPPSKEPWVKNGSINVKSTDRLRLGASSKDILDGVRKLGYFVWPSPKKR